MDECGWIINPLPSQTHKEIKCGEPATSSIRIRDSVTKAEVPVCAKHKADYNTAQANNRKRKSPSI